MPKPSVFVVRDASGEFIRYGYSADDDQPAARTPASDEAHEFEDRAAARAAVERATDRVDERHLGEATATEAEDTSCLYCSRPIPHLDTVPSVGDDAAWSGLAKGHAHDCEWVATRAHRRPAAD